MAVRAKRKADRSDEYLAGVPNRDLEDEDYERLTAEQQAEIEASGLWTVRKEAESADSK